MVKPVMVLELRNVLIHSSSVWSRVLMLANMTPIAQAFQERVPADRLWLLARMRKRKLDL